jgi:HNH endonuclease
MIMLSCIYCKNKSFQYDCGSKEHVILSSLGGIKASKNICCEVCNNRLGNEIDEPFADNFSFFSTMFNITTGRKKKASILKNEVEYNGNIYDLQPGGKFKLSKGSVRFKDSGGFSIVAGSREQAITLLEQAKKKSKESTEDSMKIEAKSTRVFLPPQEKKLDIGGNLQFRSAAKMLITYLATCIKPDRLRDGSFDKTISFIDENSSDFLETYIGDCGLLFNLDRYNISNINHRVFIFASQEKRIVVGVLELFGAIRYTVKLSNVWNGPDFSRAYVIDPVEGKNQNLESLFNFTFDNYKECHQDSNTVINEINSLVYNFQERQYKKHSSEIIADAMNRHMKEGELITDETLFNLASEIGNKFVQNFNRLDSEDSIDL